MAYCKPCNRSFINIRALEQHLQSKHPCTYCFRCRKHFPHTRAKQQHIEDSTRHNICCFCPNKLDFDDQTGLDQHLEKHHHICSGCLDQFDSSFQLVQHDQDVHDICSYCKKTFSSPSDLKSHLKTHMERTIECPGCDRMFISSSAMVLHLESGFCPSGASEDTIVDVGMACEYSPAYLSNHWDFDFKCPTCGEDLVLMSALLQHAESVAGCDVELETYGSLWQFLEFLKQRLGGHY